MPLFLVFTVIFFDCFFGANEVVYENDFGTKCDTYQDLLAQVIVVVNITRVQTLHFCTFTLRIVGFAGVFLPQRLSPPTNNCHYRTMLTSHEVAKKRL